MNDYTGSPGTAITPPPFPLGADRPAHAAGPRQCGHRRIGEFWQADDSVGPRGFTAYAFADAGDRSLIWSGGVWEEGNPESPDGSSWSAEVRRREHVAWDELHAEGFEDAEAAIAWCESQRRSPECGRL